MTSARLLPFPTSPDDFHKKIMSVGPEEQTALAKAWAKKFVENALIPEASEMWLLRQCLRYFPAEIIGNYLSTNVVHNTPAQVADFWLGSPVDWEGAVRMMESAYSEAGWRAVIFPPVQPQYSAQQAARILRVLQQTGDHHRTPGARIRESIFLEGFGEDARPTDAVKFWHQPHKWLASQKINKEDQMSVWCAYALVGEPNILLKVAKALEWKGWEVGEFLLDWDKVTSPAYHDRLEAAEELWRAHNQRAPKVPMPTNLDFKW